MSLVEQAARKLEQLRKAGEQVAGDLAYPASDSPVASPPGKGSTIERMATELEKRQRSTPPTPATPTSDPFMPGDLSVDVESGGTVTDRKRREPVLQPGLPSHLQPRPLASPQPSAPNVFRPRTIEIDLKQLAARGLLTPDASQSRLANEMRVIKRPLINNCLSRSAVKNGNRIMITSSVPGEGKSYIATNLALTIATERDSTVLLVEADPTRPSLSELFGIPAGRGLMDLLTEPRLEVADVLVRTSIGRLSFIPAGTPQEHATELLASGAMERLVDQLASRYPDRIVIFDSAPLLAAPEARVLARHMGQIVMVVAAETTTHSIAQQALALIESCPIVMTVLNKASAHQETAYYYAG